MMSLNDLREAINNRKCLLWIVNDISHNQSVADITNIAKFYWEACWTQSTEDIFFDAAIKIAEESGYDKEKGLSPRQPYRFSADPDREGDINRRLFFPIYETQGSSRTGETDGRYDIPNTRRINYQLNQYRKLEIFNSYSLVVIGANGKDDLSQLFSALDFAPRDLDVYILSTFEDTETFDYTTNNKITFLQLSTGELVDILDEFNAPYVSSFSHLSIRYGREDISVTESDIFYIIDNFHLITTQDFVQKTDNQQSVEETFKSLEKFQGDWTPYLNHFVFTRHYKPRKNGKRNLSEYFLHQLSEIRDKSERDNLTIQIPATSGSGITTTLREMGFSTALAGFPTLVCQSKCKSISHEQILSFLTLLRNQSSRSGDVPAVIIFDREHQSLDKVESLASNLDARGRKAIIVQVIPPENSREIIDTLDEVDAPVGRRNKLDLFMGEIDKEEIQDLCNHFTNILKDENIVAPSYNDWIAYQENNQFIDSGIEESTDSLFWIALRYFVSNDDSGFDYSDWIYRTCQNNVQNEYLKKSLKSIAAFSVYGISVPITTLMRSLGFSSVYDTEIMNEVSYLCDTEEILDWHPREDVIHDQAIGFKHRIVASQYLRRLGVTNYLDPLDECINIVKILGPSSEADNWLIDALVFQGMRPGKKSIEDEEHLSRILSVYLKIPPIVAERNQSIQHHWARTLQQLASLPTMESNKLNLLIESVSKLYNATNLYQGNRTRENPRNIHNTLGSVLTELSKYYFECDDQEKGEKTWSEAAIAFEKAVGFDPDNCVVLSAFATRLIDHAKSLQNDEEGSLQDLTTALSYLDRALNVQGIPQDEEASLIKWKLRAYEALDESKLYTYIEKIKEQQPELWALVRCQYILKDISSDDWQSGKRKELGEASSILSEVYKNNSDVGWRLLFLLYRVITSYHETKFDFSYRKEILDQLATTSFKWDAKLSFARAVLYYQNDEFALGQELFVKLRSAFNTGQLEPRNLTSFLREKTKKIKPRLVNIRVTQIITEWHGFGDVQEMGGQRVIVRPRWFDDPPKIHHIRPCLIQFGPYGPIAVPQSRRCSSNID